MNGLSRWADGIAARLIRFAAAGSPAILADRLEEEWLAAISEQSGQLSRLRFALGCCWAAIVITHDQPAVTAPAARSVTLTAGDRNMAVAAYHPTSLFSRRIPVSVSGRDLCDINTTPLIDVMLVLLVTLIITLPVMTHAVTLDLPQTPASLDQPRPEVVDLEIDADGTVVWNGHPVADEQQLESYFRAEAQKDVQPEVHLRADRRAKYGVVARVLASAQRNRLKKIGFVDTAEFRD